MTNKTYPDSAARQKAYRARCRAALNAARAELRANAEAQVDALYAVIVPASLMLSAPDACLAINSLRGEVLDYVSYLVFLRARKTNPEI